MGDRESHGSLLSREELGALLEEVAAGQQQEAQRRWMRPSGLEEAVGSRAELMRVAERFSLEENLRRTAEVYLKVLSEKGVDRTELRT